MAGVRAERSYPLFPSFSARVIFLSEVPQVVIVVEIEKFHQILKCKSKRNYLVISGTECQLRPFRENSK